MQDSFNVKGIHSTIGYVSFINRPAADTNSPLVDILLENGAVLYVKTNIPQTLMVRSEITNCYLPRLDTMIDNNFLEATQPLVLLVRVADDPF